MKIMGLDPGLARVGWALIASNSVLQKPLGYGCITTSHTDTQGNRLRVIHTSLNDLFKLYKPDVMSIEDLFFGSNVTTAFTVGQARGVALLTAELNQVPVVSYSPIHVKLSVCGNGHADKKQVLRMIMEMLKLANPPKPDDTADALAIALTHAYSYKMKEKLI